MVVFPNPRVKSLSSYARPRPYIGLQQTSTHPPALTVNLGHEVHIEIGHSALLANY